jgi:hypothetical protein
MDFLPKGQVQFGDNRFLAYNRPLALIQLPYASFERPPQRPTN